MTPQQADELFRALQYQYAERRNEAESTVAEWRWYAAPFQDLRPLFLERHGDLPGSALRKRPSRTSGRVEAGFDVDARVKVERRYNEYGCYETFYRWDARPIEAAHYDYYVPTKRGINILLLTEHEGRPSSSDLIAERGWTHEDYEWDGSRLMEIRVSHSERLDGHFRNPKPFHVVRPLYDGHDLRRIELHWAPDPPKRPQAIVETVYDRPTLPHRDA